MYDDDALHSSFANFFVLSHKLIPGSRDGHVQAHEPPGGPQDHGGDQEGGGVRGVAPRQLHGQDPGKIQEPSQYFTQCSLSEGSSEHGALCRPEQPHQATGAVQASN